LGTCGLDSSGSGYGPVAGCCENGNEPSGSIKGGEFLDSLSDCQLLNKDFALWSHINREKSRDTFPLEILTSILRVV
jgi:hypothetical protein